ncbi:MAG: hypothetical protein ACTSU9_08230 [Promethearchaeota archaeon]
MDGKDRLYFVLGHYQPEGRVIALLKYVPDPEGTWIKRDSGRRYLRSYWHQGMDAFKDSTFLASRQADSDLDSWSIIDPVFNTRFLEIPLGAIRHHFVPEDGIRNIMSRLPGALDPVESAVKHVVRGLNDACGAVKGSFKDIGITGSILWGGHSDRSDINLNVYGRDTCIKLREELVNRAGDSPRLSEHLSVVMKGFGKVSGIVDGGEIRRKVKLKLDAFSPGVQIRWCLRKGEFPIRYGDEVYRDIGFGDVNLEVIDDTYSIFYPAVIGVRELDETREGEGVSRIMIYDTRYVRLFRKGDVVKISGMVQGINNGKNQILIGSKKYYLKERVQFLQRKTGG